MSDHWRLDIFRRKSAPINKTIPTGEVKMNINYSDAVKYAGSKGITKDAFIEYADKKLGVSESQAKELFNKIDRNGSSGLREREFNNFKSNAGAIDGDGGSSKGGTTSNSGSSNISGRGGSSLDNISGVKIGTTDRLIRDGDGGRKINDEFKTNGADYLLLAESHGRSHNQLGLKDAPKIEGHQVIGGGGSGDKSAFMYKRVSNVDVATIEGNIGSGTVTRIYSDKNLGFRAETTDPSYNNSAQLNKPGNKEIGLYFEDEGGKGNRNQSFDAAGFKTISGGDGDDQIDIMPDSWSKVPNGNGAQGFIFEK